MPREAKQALFPDDDIDGHTEKFGVDVSVQA
jgi:hypothetical protein